MEFVFSTKILPSVLSLVDLKLNDRKSKPKKRNERAARIACLLRGSFLAVLLYIKLRRKVRVIECSFELDF